MGKGVIPAFAIVGWKNSGKTGLVVRLVEWLSARGLKIATVKHAHHGFDIDREGTDSFRHRLAGAREVTIISDRRVASVRELDGESGPLSLAAILERMAPADMALVEGFKSSLLPKIEAYRAATGKQMLAMSDRTVRAIASDCHPETDLPLFDLNDTCAIAGFILSELGLEGKAGKPETDSAAKGARRSTLPPGVDWTPARQVLADLRATFGVVVGQEEIAAEAAGGRILAQDVAARIPHPPHSNSAVDGYGIAGPVPSGSRSFPLVSGRAAAGRPFAGKVPAGHAVRILTGAPLPAGVDRVVLDEFSYLQGKSRVRIDRSVRCGANTRGAGEDFAQGARIARAGRCLAPADLALLAAGGVTSVHVRKLLRVAIMSTGDELEDPGRIAGGGMIADANAPMLCDLVRRWGARPLLLPRVPDSQGAVAAAFDRAREVADVLLATGGASAGEEDHVSATLRLAGRVRHWRIAIKPGRPMVVGEWQDMPVFGLPGNPVAAMVCALVFARPVLGCLAGREWEEPQGFTLPARFSKDKGPGRSEYLRARIRDGGAEVFVSEGSGRITGLSWAGGLVRLDDQQAHIRPGDPVTYIPFASFGVV